MDEDIKKEDLISVIIPYYNGPPQYLKECLQSIYNQIYKNLEIIIVDDGSDKEYADYLDEMPKQFISGEIDPPCIIHKPRGGISTARNHGIYRSKGEYVCFVDADDLISPDFISCLYFAAHKYDCRIAACELEKFKDEDTLTFVKADVSFSVYEDVDIYRNVNTGYCVTKLYHKSVFEKVKFDETINMSEDTLFINQVLSYVKKCCATNHTLYFYRVNPNSSSRTANSSKYLQAVSVAEYVQSIEIVKNNTDVYRNFALYKGVYLFKYMISLCQEGHAYQKVKDAKKYFIQDIYPYTHDCRDNWIKIAKLLVHFPMPIYYISLKVIGSMIKKLRLR